MARRPGGARVFDGPFRTIIIFFVVISIIRMVKSVLRGGRRDRPRSRGTRTRRHEAPASAHGRRDHSAHPPAPSLQRSPPPLGLTTAHLDQFVSLQTPNAAATDVVETTMTLQLGADRVAVEMAAFVWHWMDHDDGRFHDVSLPVALARLPAPVRLPTLLLRRPGKGPDWDGVVRTSGRNDISRAWDLPDGDPRVRALFVRDFLKSMAVRHDHLVFEADADLIVVLPRKPRRDGPAAPMQRPALRLAPAAATTADELPAMLDQSARLLEDMPATWWELVGAGDAAQDAAQDPDSPAPVDPLPPPSWPSRGPDPDLG